MHGIIIFKCTTINQGYLNKLYTVKFAILCFALVVCTGAMGQCGAPLPVFQNPSFEGSPRANQPPYPWSICMPDETPDTQPGQWGITLPAANGSTYVGMVAEPSADWQEGVAQRIASPLVAGTTYSFTIDLANSSSTQGGIVPGCAECQIWGGYNACDTNTLLWHSGNITPYDQWQLDTVTFTPAQNFTWMMFRINSLGCSSQPYIMLDNISSVITIPLVTAQVTNVSCYGANDGSAVLHVSDPNGPCTYTWSNVGPHVDSALYGVGGGFYSVTVTDSSSCSTVVGVNIFEPAPLQVTNTIVSPLCFGQNNGSAQVSVTGGTVPYQYHWTNACQSDNNTNLMAGTYYLTVSDDSMCTLTDTIVITQPGRMALQSTLGSPACSGKGSASVSVTSGGTPPFTYQWTNGETSQLDTGLVAGNYSVIVRDSNLCQATLNVRINHYKPMMMNVIATPPDCYNDSDGSANVYVYGGADPITYLWSTGATSQDISNLTAGMYVLTVKDDSLCTVTDTLNVGEPTQIMAITSDTAPGNGLQNGSVIINGITGGNPPYSITWSNGETGLNDVNLVAGTYSFTITDNSGCTQSDTISLIPTAVQSLTGNLQVSAYPNPTHGVLWLDVPAGNDITTLNLFDVLGQRLRFEELTSTHNAMDLSTLAGGVYTLVIRQGEREAVMQVVRQ